MDNQSADADEMLTKALRAMGTRLDPVPDEMIAAATSAFSLRTLDKELAALDYDSLLDDDLRSAWAPEGRRHLTFVSGSLSVEVDVGTDGLLGRLVPPTAAEVEVRWPGGGTSVATDESGAFSAAAVPPGPVSLRCRRRPSDTSSPVVTDWVTL